MLELVAITILMVGLVEMGVVVVYKIPVLRNLPISKEELSKKKKISWSSVFKEIRKKIKLFYSSFKKKFFMNFKNSKKRYLEEKKPDFSKDYWKKVRKE